MLGLLTNKMGMPVLFAKRRRAEVHSFTCQALESLRSQPWVSYTVINPLYDYGEAVDKHKNVHLDHMFGRIMFLTCPIPPALPATPCK